MIRERAIWQGNRVDTNDVVEGYYYEVPAPPKCIGTPDKPKGFITCKDPNNITDWGMPQQMVTYEVDPNTVVPVAVKVVNNNNDTLLCPNCNIDMMGCGLDEDPLYCYKCGQRLDWSMN